MFACLYSLSTPVAVLVKRAEDFTPRFEVVGPLVMLDVSGLSQLLGTPQEIGEQLRRASSGPVRIALAPTQTAAALLALGRAGLTVVMAGEQPERLASLPVSLLGDFDRLRFDPAYTRVPVGPPPRKDGVQPPQVSAMSDVLPYFTSCLDRTTETVVTAHCSGGGWMHPRDSHAANHTRRSRRLAEAASGVGVGGHPAPGSSPAALGIPSATAGLKTRRSSGQPASARVDDSRELRRGEPASARGDDSGELRRGEPASARVDDSRELRRGEHSALAEIQSLQETLRRWGIKTLGALALLPAGDVYERLGARGVRWQRLARGEDTSPLVPWIPEDPFEASLDLEWPIEGLEPLSFVLGRLLEPVAERLERADRGAAILHTHLRLVSKEVHARTLQLPAPMRDPKTLRTLALLDLESNPPAAAIDRVSVLVEPTPARVMQWRLFERAQPSPEQVSTLIARLSALMGERHVGSPALVNSWKPGAFAMTPFAVPSAGCPVPRATSHVSGAAPSTVAPHTPRSHPTPGTSALGTSQTHPASSTLAPGTSLVHPAPGTGHPAPYSALRRFRLPVPVRVHVTEGRPVRVMTDRRGVTGGVVVQAAGPWRTSGEWWNDTPSLRSNLDGASARQAPANLADASAGQAPTNWDRDEWDVAIADGTVYRVFVERTVGQWFIEGVID